MTRDVTVGGITATVGEGFPTWIELQQGDRRIIMGWATAMLLAQAMLMFAEHAKKQDAPAEYPKR